MNNDQWKELADKARKVAASCDAMVKHFDGHDSRHPSATHGAGASQKVHGNRPGARTQSGLLESWQLTPGDWHSRAPQRQTDYFLRATGYSTPVIDIGGGHDHYLAPPGVKMLPERGAAVNVDSPGGGTPPAPNTQLAQGLDHRDLLTLPGDPNSEESKRYLEAAAEHRQNDYQGPTTPRFEQMWGDQLRSQHPHRDPEPSGGATPQEQTAILRGAVAQAQPSGDNVRAPHTPRLHRIGAHRDEATLVANLIQNVPEAAKHQQLAHEAIKAVMPGGQTEGSQGQQKPEAAAAHATAEQQQATQQQAAQTEQQRIAEERRRRNLATQTRGRRLPGRLQ